MQVGKFKPYRNIIGSIEVNDDGEYYGRLLDINGFVNYHSDSLKQLEEEFHKAVDDYLDMLDKHM